MRVMRCALLVVAVVLSAAPVLAQTCDEMTAQDLNSRIEAALTIQETGENLTAETEQRINELRSEFATLGDQQTQALDGGDAAQLDEVCRKYKEILGEVEALGN